MNYKTKISFSVIGIFLIQLLAVGCAQKVLQPNQIVQRFDSQMFFVDKKSNKNHQLNMEIVAKRNQKMRLDAKVVLGVHLASILMTPEKVQVAMHSEKKSYEGPSNSKVLQKTLGFPLHPLVIHAMVYRQGLKGQGWSCRISDGKVHRCVQAGADMSLTWEELEDSIMVTADSKSFNMQWKIFPPENTEERSNYFELKVPDSYEKLLL